MGKKPRTKPRRLGKKLRQIRRALGLSQNEMLKQMGLDGEHTRNNLSNFELDRREPPSPIVLGYARLARIRVELILDDKLELPDRLLRIPTRSRVTH
jgi:transcriptional regulator with XRE-family HTH domain